MEKIYPAVVNVRLTVALREKLRQVAETEEVSMSDVVRELIANRLGGE
jgi:hypothetical protein